jgi:hypothetical protein
MYKEHETYIIDETEVYIENITETTLGCELGDECNEEDKDTVIISECTFTVKKGNTKLAVEAHHVIDDSDMYGINVWDISKEDTRKWDAPNHIGDSVYDSCGGCTVDEELYARNSKQNFELIILYILFGKNGIIIAF